MASSASFKVVITGAWPAMTPKSPSVPGTTTMWTSSLRASFSGVTSSKCRSAIVGLSLDRGVDRVRDGVELAGDAGEDFGDVERLAQEALDLAGAADGQLIFFGKLVHAEDGDDVLQALVALQRLLDGAGDLIMLLTDHRGGQHAA